MMNDKWGCVFFAVKGKYGWLWTKAGGWRKLCSVCKAQIENQISGQQDEWPDSDSWVRGMNKNRSPMNSSFFFVHFACQYLLFNIFCSLCMSISFIQNLCIQQWTHVRSILLFFSSRKWHRPGISELTLNCISVFCFWSSFFQTHILICLSSKEPCALRSNARKLKWAHSTEKQTLCDSAFILFQH